MGDNYYAIRWTLKGQQSFIGSPDHGIIYYPHYELARAHIQMVIDAGGAASYEIVKFPEDLSPLPEEFLAKMRESK